jgi:hypothetical protein
MKIAVIASFLLGFAMFFVRVQETSNWKISCKKFFLSTSDDTDLLINPDQPLTAIINKTMNLEFICCILNGLTQISQKRDKNDSIKLKEASKEVTSISLSQVFPGGITSNQSNLDVTNNRNIPIKKKKKMYKKFNCRDDFKKVKPHHIYYNNYHESFNVNEIVMKVAKPTTNDYVSDSEYNTQSNELNEFANKKHDAILMEYCPKIFKAIRQSDGIPEYELEK